VLVGYRWLDHKKIEPLFPFGFGLSYTSFAYSGLKAHATADGGMDVSVKIQNTGLVAGDEVAQVYVNKPARIPQGVQFADSILAGFERVQLAAGESKDVVIHVAQRQFQYWSTAQHQWLTAAGTRSYWVGGSSRDHRIEGRLVVK
jgi:beta-glucosidase